MAFTPEKPDAPTDLKALMANNFDEVTTILYDSDEGLFYRMGNVWIELTPEAHQKYDLEGNKGINVRPEFIAVFDAADQEDIAITEVEALKYQA